MNELVHSSAFGVGLTVLAYWLGVKIQRKTGLVICNAMILSVLFVAAALVIFDIPYEAYFEGGSLIHLFLPPATVCLAVTIYSKLELLKRYWLPVLVGCFVGTGTSVGSILLLCRLFGLDRAMTMSLLPKSVTTPIAAAVAEGHGGIVSIAVAAVIFTGILGNLVAPLLAKLFRVKEPMAVGLGIGACSHALGTVKALELGETEGAMSGLAMGLCGIMTAAAALLFSCLIFKGPGPAWDRVLFDIVHEAPARGDLPPCRCFTLKKGGVLIQSGGPPSGGIGFLNRGGRLSGRVFPGGPAQKDKAVHCHYRHTGSGNQQHGHESHGDIGCDNAGKDQNTEHRNGTETDDERVTQGCFSHTNAFFPNLGG